jgi:hypothetical protein
MRYEGCLTKSYRIIAIYTKVYAGAIASFIQDLPQDQYIDIVRKTFVTYIIIIIQLNF